MFRKWAKIAAVVTLISLPLVIGAIYRNSTQAIYRSLINYPAEITIATGPEGGLYRSLSEDLAETIRTELSLDVRLVPTDGSLDNLLRLQKGEADFALYQPGTFEVSQEYDPSFTVDIAFVAKLYSQPAHFIVRRGTGIETPADLRGKRVQLGLKNSGDYAMSLILLDHFGLDEEAVEAKYLGYTKVKEGFRDDQLDAAFITIGIQAPIFPELFNIGKCDLLSIPYAEAIATKNISLSPYQIPRGLYRTQPVLNPAQDVATVSSGAQLLTHTDVHHELVKEVTRLIMNENFQKRNQLGELYIKGRAYAQEKPEYPMHPGARSFYDPEFDIHIFESLDAIYSLVASVLIAVFLLARGLSRMRTKSQEHQLDRHIQSILEIERRQISLDSNLDKNDVETLQKLLDEVTYLKQGALRELGAHELNEDQAIDSFIHMCHALSDKINAKLTRQRLDQGFSEITLTLNQADKTSSPGGESRSD